MSKQVLRFWYYVLHILYNHMLWNTEDFLFPFFVHVCVHHTINKLAIVYDYPLSFDYGRLYNIRRVYDYITLCNLVPNIS